MSDTTQISWRVKRLSIGLLVCFALSFFVFPVMAAGLETIDPTAAAALIEREKDNPDFVILDIRTAKEFEQGHLAKAVLLDYYDNAFVEGLKALDKKSIYLVYCRSGNRSGKALAIFEELGFSRVYNMAHGINGWMRSGLPLGG